MRIRGNRYAPPTVLAYGVAVAVVVAALLIRFSINFWLGPRVPYLQFFPAILVAAWYGGFGPGVLAAFLSALCAHIWFLQPLGLFKIPVLADVHSLSLFVLAGCGIAYLSGQMKRAEAAQRQTADQWRTTLASIGDGVIVTDIAGRVTFINSAAARLTGWNTTDAVHRPLHEIFVITNEDSGQAVESPVARVLRDGALAGLPNRTLLQHRDGHWTPIEDSGAPIRGATQDVEGVVLVFRDMTAKHAADEALRRSQMLLETISDNSPTVIYAKDLDGRYLFINRRYSELFHVSLEDMVGKTDHDVFDKDAADAFRAMDRRVVEAGVPITGEETAPQDDGLHTYVSVKCPLLDAHGTPYATFGLSTDITELKRSEEALRATEERTRAIVDTALDAVITIDTAGAITGWSPQAERTFGWQQQEAIGRLLVDMIIPERYREAHRSGLARYVATGEARVLNQRLELSALDRNGREFPVELAITPIRVGETTSFSAFVRDISERKRSEERVRAQLERLDLLDRITRAIGERQDLGSVLQVVVGSLEDHLPLDFCCICLYDPADESLTVACVGAKSAAMARDMGIVEQARIAVDANGLSRCVRGQLVYEPNVAANAFPFPQRLSGGGLRSLVAAPLLVESHVFGVLVAARREADRFASAECEFLRQLSGHVALAAHQARLHTALQQAYDDLRQTQQAVMQQERLKALGQMASGIAHDINNAISPIALYTESLLEGERHLSERGRSHLSTIQRAIEDVAQTVARMREFYRAREPQLLLTPVDLNRVAQEAVELTRARWSDMPQQRGTVIRLNLAAAEDTPSVMGVESEIREALINLIFNAVDAMPEGGSLTIRTRSSQTEPAGPRTAYVEVVDTGAGMDAETRRRCLEPFFTTKGERGTGLGLAMVYGMVQRHGAEIEIESTLGSGTLVRLSFVAPAAEHEAKQTRSGAYARPSRLRILVVDDDPLLLKSLRDTLEGDGHSVGVANGGQAGIDAFQAAIDGRKPFDVVITDLGMPHVDGRQVASRIKQASPSTPIVLLTGWGQRLVDEGSVPSHIDRVMNKPPKLSELRPALAELTANRPA
jgi:PAS domain S-box-containing protein